MKNTENRRVKMTKRLIKDALIEILCEQPMSKVSIKQICERADINRSTFYAHYTDQYNLLEEIEDDVLNDTPVLPMERSDPFRNDLKEYFETVEKRKLVYKVLLQNSNSNRFKHRILAKLYAGDPDTTWLHNMDIQTPGNFDRMMIAFGTLEIAEKWVFGELSTTPANLAENVYKFMNR